MAVPCFVDRWIRFYGLLQAGLKETQAGLKEAQAGLKETRAGSKEIEAGDFLERLKCINYRKAAVVGVISQFT